MRTLHTLLTGEYVKFSYNVKRCQQILRTIKLRRRALIVLDSSFPSDASLTIADQGPLKTPSPYDDVLYMTTLLPAPDYLSCAGTELSDLKILMYIFR